MCATGLLGCERDSGPTSPEAATIQARYGVVSGSPGPLTDVALVYDSKARQVVLLGGTSGEGDWNFNKEVWVTDPDGERWRRVGTHNLDIDCAAYDPVADRIIAFVGWRYDAASTNPNFPIDFVSETWAYDLNTNTWDQIESPRGPRAGNVGTRMAYDVESRKMILFGGIDLETFELIGETWVLDYASRTWTRMDPWGDVPTGRNFMGLTYHRGIDRVLMIGATDPDFNATNDLYAYDYNANRWARIPSDGPVRDYVSLANLGGARERILLYGGVTYDATSGEVHMGDTWELSLARDQGHYRAVWELMAPSPSPGPRASHGLIGAGAGRAVLYGGGGDGGTLGDTWLYRSHLHRVEWERHSEGAALADSRRAGALTTGEVPRRRARGVAFGASVRRRRD
jgi:hypothetical protein